MTPDLIDSIKLYFEVSTLQFKHNGGLFFEAWVYLTHFIMRATESLWLCNTSLARKTPRNGGFLLGTPLASVRLMNTLRLTNTLFDNFFNSGLDHIYYIDDDYDYEEHDDTYKYELNLAGFKKENIKVTAENGRVKITAKQGDKSYSKLLSLPKKADPNSSVIKYEDGLLNITINKKEGEKRVELEIN